VSNALGLSVRAFDVRNVDDLTRAFTPMIEWQANGLITHADALLFSQRRQVVKLALDNGLAAVHPEAEFPEAGGLLSYGPSLPRSVPPHRVIRRQDTKGNKAG
jgi:putative ABC transport system substrate-binding protein